MGKYILFLNCWKFNEKEYFRFNGFAVTVYTLEGVWPYKIVKNIAIVILGFGLLFRIHIR